MDKEPTFQVKGSSFMYINTCPEYLSNMYLCEFDIKKRDSFNSIVHLKNKPHVGIRYMHLFLVHRNSRWNAEAGKFIPITSENSGQAQIRRHKDMS
jgi:hypothetical protein